MPLSSLHRGIAASAVLATLGSLAVSTGAGAAHADASAPGSSVKVVAGLTSGGYGDLAWHDGRIYATHNNDEIVSFAPDGSDWNAVMIPQAWRVSPSSFYDRTSFVVAPDGSYYLQAPVDNRNAFGVGHLSADGTTISPTEPPPNNGDTTPFRGGEEGLALSADGKSIYVASHYSDYVLGSVSRLSLPLPADQHDGTLEVGLAYDPNGPDVDRTPFSPGNGVDARTQAVINRGPTGLATRGRYLYVREHPSWVHRVDTVTHEIVTIAGKADGETVPPVEGGLATGSSMVVAAGPAVDRKGNVFIATSTDGNRAHNASTVVWEIRASDGTLHRVAGVDPDVLGEQYPEDGDDPLSLELHVGDLELDPQGNLYLSSYQGFGRPNQILRIDGVGTPDLTVSNGVVAFQDIMPDANTSIDLITADADGQHRTNLTNTPTTNSGKDWNIELHPSWSPDGTRLAYFSFAKADGSDGGIYAMDADGTHRTRLLPYSTTGLADWIDWSPDGKSLLYGRVGKGVSLVRSDGTGARLLLPDTFEGMSGVGSPDWSPDGTRIAFSARKDGVRQVFTVGADASDLVQVTQGPLDSDDPAYSPDGDRLLFSRAQADDPLTCPCHDLWTSKVDGSGAALLLDTGKNDIEPTWSPDGTRIAFQRHTLSGPHIIVTVAADGSDLHELGSGDDPDWQPVADHVSDSDGIPDRFDNCPAVNNPGQDDFDANGLGDACDVDSPRLVTTGKPVLSAGPVVGTPTTVTGAAWAPSTGTSTFAWFVADEQVATGTTYTPIAADAGKTLRVVETRTAAGFPNATATSLDSTVLTRVPVSTSPKITAVTSKGKVVAVKVGSPATSSVAGATTTAYQWVRTDGTTVTTIAGATSSTYTLKPADSGTALTVRVALHATGYADSTATSNAYKVAGRFSKQPTVTYKTGRALASTAPVVVGRDYRLTYVWRYQYSRTTVKTIAGATGLKMSTTKGQKGKAVWLVATATRTGFPTITTSSNKVTGR